MSLLWVAIALTSTVIAMVLTHAGVLVPQHRKKLARPSTDLAFQVVGLRDNARSIDLETKENK